MASEFASEKFCSQRGGAEWGDFGLRVRECDAAFMKVCDCLAVKIAFLQSQSHRYVLGGNILFITIAKGISG